MNINHWNEKFENTAERLSKEGAPIQAIIRAIDGSGLSIEKKFELHKKYGNKGKAMMQEGLRKEQSEYERKIRHRKE